MKKTALAVLTMLMVFTFAACNNNNTSSPKSVSSVSSEEHISSETASTETGTDVSSDVG